MITKEQQEKIDELGKEVINNFPHPSSELRDNALEIINILLEDACINAETGVGPAIASGSQVYKGICALLAAAPRKNNKEIPIASVVLSVVRAVSIPFSELYNGWYEAVPKEAYNQKIASKNPASPIRFITKAFLAASLLA